MKKTKDWVLRVTTDVFWSARKCEFENEYSLIVLEYVGVYGTTYWTRYKEDGKWYEIMGDHSGYMRTSLYTILTKGKK